MTAKDFTEKKNKKTLGEFRDWFDSTATEIVNLQGIRIPCIRLSKNKVGLRDGSIVETGNESKISHGSEFEMKKAHDMQHYYRLYNLLDPIDALSVNNLMDIFERKMSLENRMNHTLHEVKGETMYCSFCKRSNDSVTQMIVGPDNLCICGKCVKMCGEILKGAGDEY